MNFVVSIIALTGLLCCVSVAEGYNYTSLGCYADFKGQAKGGRAIASLEGTSDLLDGRFRRRQNATEKCAELAYSLNFTIFAVARGGECLGDGQSNDTFSMHGPSDNCQTNGKGGRRPPAMEVYEITADVCQELEVDCYGDCCDGTSDEMRCYGYWDYNTGCKLSADYCMPWEMPNSHYAKSLGAPEVCPNYCSYPCNYPEELSCWDNSYGCGFQYCHYIGNNNYTGQGTAMRASDLPPIFPNTCAPTCPTRCSQYDLVCSSGNDANGCPYPEHCTPLAYDNWDGSECPGVCYTPCDWNAGEVYCPIVSENGCYAGNTCEMPDADGNACQGTAMRMDPEDELMLRSGSPDSVSAFYKKLTDMTRK